MLCSVQFTRKGGSTTETEAARQDTRKAMAYDLLYILKRNEKGKTYTYEEIEALIEAYLTGSEK